MELKQLGEEKVSNRTLSIEMKNLDSKSVSILFETSNLVGGKKLCLDWNRSPKVKIKEHLM